MLWWALVKIFLCNCNFVHCNFIKADLRQAVMSHLCILNMQ